MSIVPTQRNAIISHSCTKFLFSPPPPNHGLPASYFLHSSSFILPVLSFLQTNGSKSAFRIEDHSHIRRDADQYTFPSERVQHNLGLHSRACQHLHVRLQHCVATIPSSGSGLRNGAKSIGPPIAECLWWRRRRRQLRRHMGGGSKITK